MERRTYRADHGDIVYWVARCDASSPWLVFLPGLTADHRLFESQLACFESRTNCLTWDPPSHGESRPFPLVWTMSDLARYLHGILKQDGIKGMLEKVGQGHGVLDIRHAGLPI